MNTRNLVFSAVAGLGLLASTPAAAEPILLDANEVGESFTIDFDGFVNGDVTVDGLSSQLILTLTSIVGNVYNFDYSMANTSDTDAGVDSLVSSFAFNTDPEISGATSTGTYNFTNTDSNYPNQIGTVDVCFQAANTGSCAGNRGGVAGGESGSGTLALSFDSALSSLTLDDFYVRYQSVSGAGAISSASGRQVTTSTSSGNEVPEPNMMLLFGLAALMIFAGTRRRREVKPALATVSYS
ncbi:cistern family PEP-CTERM protein [Qipengyuania seohaensis]|uniref:cistern family PEP-CTERM protein n=1 Tax=Qipengyuania seohaensis TaxID=266951 RepID=UPI000C226726|nr:cistern family PEP-CTERM protein [Qipengyuania seohaensis]